LAISWVGLTGFCSPGCAAGGAAAVCAAPDLR
jgi:hypothetical protein